MSSAMLKSDEALKSTFKRNRVHPAFSPSFSKFKNRQKNVKKLENRTSERFKYGLQRSTKLFIEITNGKSANMGRSPSPSPRRVMTPEEDEEEQVEVPLPPKKEEEEVVEITPAIEEEEIEKSPNEEKPSASKTEFFDRISEKASKLISKKKSLGKLFGEKESDIKIYTIDREMAKTKIKPKTYEETITNLELSSKLQKSRQNIPMGENLLFKSVGCMANPYPPYRLFFLPPNDWNDPDCLTSSILKIILCQSTLASFLLIWLIFGALTFYLTEGPYEYTKMQEFQERESSLIVSLATDLRLLKPDIDSVIESPWKDKIEKHIFVHKQLVLEHASNNYGDQEVYWTYSGSIMFATSLLTTLGLATPLPLTTAGSIEAFLFTLIGAPIHFLFLTHLGKLIALKIQLISKEIENKFFDLRRRIINVRRFGEDVKSEKEIWPDKMFLIDFKPPSWLRFFPLVSTVFYYILGMLIFGLGREMDFPRILLFPLDFARCDASTSGISRIGYAWYIEGVAILTSINIALLRETSFSGITSAGIKYGFMTNSLD